MTTINLSHDKKCVLASTLDNTIRLFDFREGELLNEYHGHENTKYKVESCLSFSDADVISGSEDGSLFIWDLVEANKAKQKLEHAHTSISCSISAHPHANHFISGGADGIIILWSSSI